MAARLAVDTALDSERRPGKGRIRVERGEGTNRLERGKSTGLGVVPSCLARSCILVARRSPSIGQSVFDCLSISQSTSVYLISISVLVLDFLYLPAYLVPVCVPWGLSPETALQPFREGS